MNRKENPATNELLDYAYIGARYGPDYRIAQEQLEYLAERVRMLLELTEKICKVIARE